MEYTPGPWYAKLHPECPFGKVRICSRHDAEYGDFHEIAYVRPNNAMLVAAAPDMLEVLERIVKIEDSHGMGVIGWSDAMDDARGIVKKARGEQ